MRHQVVVYVSTSTTNKRLWTLKFECFQMIAMGERDKNSACVIGETLHQNWNAIHSDLGGSSLCESRQEKETSEKKKTTLYLWVSATQSWSLKYNKKISLSGKQRCCENPCKQRAEMRKFVNLPRGNEQFLSKYTKQLCQP